MEAEQEWHCVFSYEFGRNVSLFGRCRLACNSHLLFCEFQYIFLAENKTKFKFD